MSKKVCMVVGNPFTNDARVAKEARSLTNSGYAVTVYAIAKESLPLFEEAGGFKVKRLGIARFSPVALKNPLRILLEVIPAIWELIQERADIYHAHDLDTLFACALAARFTGAKLVYDSHELYLEMIKSHRTTTLLKRINAAILVFFYGLIERKFIHQAAAIIDVSYFRRKVLAQRYGLEEEDITVVTNCPEKSKAVKRSRKIQQMFSLQADAKVVLYQGSLLLGRGIDRVVSALEFLPENVYLVLIGGGSDAENLQNLAKKSAFSQRVKFIPTVPLEELISYTVSADVGIIPMLNTSLNNYYTTPNKLFEYMRVGLPIVGVNFPEVAKIVKETHCGILFDPEDPQDIARALREILANPRKAAKMGRSGQEAFNKKYNWEVEEKKLLSLYQNL